MFSAEASPPTLGIIGGTGPEGSGLALRFGKEGFPILIGSRAVDRAEESARELHDVLGNGDIQGMSNADVAELADIVILAIPYGGVSGTLPGLSEAVDGKIVVSAIAPIEFQEGRPVGLRPEAGSAAQEVQGYLPRARVTSAFQTIDAHLLHDVERSLDTDVIVSSDDVEARREIVRLASRLPGVRALSGGRLSTSRYVEECTTLLILMNRIYKTHSGLRITNVDR